MNLVYTYVLDILVLGDEKGILYLYSLQEALLRTVKPFQVDLVIN
jgi:hypothetical protein